MNHKLSAIALIIYSLLLFWGCSVDGTNTSGTNVLSRLGIEDATNLFIAPGSSQALSLRAASTTNKLFKITETGYIQEVTCFDENENEITITNLPTAIYDVNTDFIIVSFSNSSYLVRKSDGAVFSLENLGQPYTGINGFLNDKIIKTDSLGNIYYLVNNRLIKINTTNPNNLSKIDYSPDTDIIDNFVVTSDGNAAYSYTTDINQNLSGRIRKSNGGLYNLGTNRILWIGLDSKIKNTDFGSNDVNTVTFDTDLNVNLSTVTGLLEPIYQYSSYLLRFPTKTLIIGPDSINEVENGSTPRIVNIPQLKTRAIAGNSNSYYYVSGTDNSDNPILLKINPSNDSVITLLPDNSIYYDISKMTVSSNDLVIFSALRMSDGVKIIGEIDSTGTVTIIDETLNTELVVLERIN